MTASKTKRKLAAMKRRPAKRRWSHQVAEESDALDLEGGVFTKRSAKAIAASLKRSAERSKRRKSDPYRSAMSMLAFYINRAGTGLPAERRRTLERAKGELRKQFGKAPNAGSRRAGKPAAGRSRSR